MSRIACLVLVSTLSLAVVGCKAKVEAKTVAELESLLSDPDPAVQSQAAYDLSLLGPEAAPAIPALIQALKSKNIAVRQNAARALGLIGPAAQAAVPPLIETLRDPEYGVRSEAATALGNIGPAASAAIPALEKLSESKDPCKSAPAALKKIRS